MPADTTIMPALGGEARASWRRHGRRVLWIPYLVALHALAAWAVWTSGFPARVAERLDWGASWVEFDAAYKRRASALLRVDEAARPGAAVFIGDSHVAALDTGALADHALNLGIAGETSRRVTARIGRYRSIRESRAVLVHVGANDPFYRTVDGFAQAYRDILAAVPAGVPVLASLILPDDARVAGPSGRATIAAYNAAIRQACAERRGCTPVDAGPAMMDATGSLDPRFHIGDGMHLSREGYAAWIEALRPALAAYAKVGS